MWPSSTASRLCILWSTGSTAFLISRLKHCLVGVIYDTVYLEKALEYFC
uniref:Uncharacterized protein n=1 Tax=Arundo donax TaxID=35708 RepID=A0A0A9BUY1_ARUDO